MHRRDGSRADRRRRREARRGGERIRRGSRPGTRVGQRSALRRKNARGCLDSRGESSARLGRASAAALSAVHLSAAHLSAAHLSALRCGVVVFVVEQQSTVPPPTSPPSPPSRRSTVGAFVFCSGSIRVASFAGGSGGSEASAPGRPPRPVSFWYSRGALADTFVRGRFVPTAANTANDQTRADSTRRIPSVSP